MKPKPSELWTRLVSEASPPITSPITPPTDDEVARIVTRLRWRPNLAAAPTWDVFLWPLLSRFALPSAAVVLLISAFLPSPPRAHAAESVDDVIAAAIQAP